MLTAIRAVVRMGGGMAVACNQSIVQQMDLPIGGLMSTAPVEYVRDQLDRLAQSARKIGCRLADPFMALSFLALPVIPTLKLTDKGLVDVERFKVVPVFV
jgi:adenine deaminase